MQQALTQLDLLQAAARMLSCLHPSMAQRKPSSPSEDQLCVNPMADRCVEPSGCLPPWHSKCNLSDDTVASMRAASLGVTRAILVILSQERPDIAVVGVDPKMLPMQKRGHSGRIEALSELGSQDYGTAQSRSEPGRAPAAGAGAGLKCSRGAGRACAFPAGG